jgi:DNA-binding LytR/AlgR family response regulator
MRCVIVDDEPEGRAIIRAYVEEIPFLELVKDCSNAFQAMEVLEQEHIDLLFLDIQMPGLDGVTFFRSLEKAPKVIFTTAFPNYAVEGFELSAVDYLLKPFPFDRFLRAVNKARMLTSANTNANQDDERYFQFKSEKRFYRVPQKSVVALESVGDYTHVYFDGGKHLVHGSLQKLLEQLQDVLLRVHRSHAVNLAYLEYAEGNFLKVGGREVPVGASFKDELRKHLEA